MTGYKIIIILKSQDPPYGKAIIKRKDNGGRGEQPIFNGNKK